MAQTDSEHKELRSYCASLLDQFGFEYKTTDPIIPTMFIMQKQSEANTEANREIAAEIKKVAEKISPKVFNFYGQNEAWKFQVGIAVKWVLFSLPVIVVIWIAAWWWSMVSDIEQAKTIISWSGNIGILANRVQKTNDGSFFIDFSKDRGDSTRHFYEYRIVNKSTLRVFLGKETKSNPTK